MRYRHKKRGTEYVLIGIGKMQAEDWEDHGPDGEGAMVDMREVAICRSVDDGSLWARPREEFEDGRFEALTAALSSAGEKDGPEVVAFLVDCPAQPTLEFANVHVPDSAEPLVRQSALTACQQEVERLTQERDEALEAENEAKDCFWAIYPDWVDMKGHGITTEAARTLLADRAEAAEARNAELVKALYPFALLADYYDQNGASDEPAEAIVPNIGDLRRARAALGGQSNEA